MTFIDMWLMSYGREPAKCLTTRQLANFQRIDHNRKHILFISTELHDISLKYLHQMVVHTKQKYFYTCRTISSVARMFTTQNPYFYLSKTAAFEPVAVMKP